MVVLAGLSLGLAESTGLGICCRRVEGRDVENAHCEVRWLRRGHSRREGRGRALDTTFRGAIRNDIVSAKVNVRFEPNWWVLKCRKVVELLEVQD